MNLISAFKIIFSYFFKQEIRARRVKVFFLLSFIPVLIILLAKIMEIANPDIGASAKSVFAEVLPMVYMKLLIPVLALLFGSIVVSEEVDNKTLVFLSTAPVPKPAVVLGKYVAYLLVSIIIVAVGLLFCFAVLNFNRMGNIAYGKEMIGFIEAAVFALASYMAFFTFLGARLKKSMVFGLIFIFFIENMAQYLPGVTQNLTFAHYIKSLVPFTVSSGSFLSFLMSPAKPATVVEAILALSLFTVVFIALAAYTFNKREYLITDSL